LAESGHIDRAILVAIGAEDFIHGMVRLWFLGKRLSRAG
jgi:hypothetical protein